jgi:hypothetical protein
VVVPVACVTGYEPSFLSLCYRSFFASLTALLPFKLQRFAARFDRVKANFDLLYSGKVDRVKAILTCPSFSNSLTAV